MSSEVHAGERRVIARRLLVGMRVVRTVEYLGWDSPFTVNRVVYPSRICGRGMVDVHGGGRVVVVMDDEEFRVE